VPIMMIRG